MKRLLRASVGRALGRMDLRSRVADALRSFEPAARSRIVVVAIGKAAPAMARGALDAWPGFVEELLVVAPDGTDASGLDDPRVKVLRARHPIPDGRSVRAAERCLELAASAATDAQCLFLALVSGGASALVCAPPAGVSLATKRVLTKQMLRSGATIGEINVVRRHLSRIKGGALARAARPARVLTLVASDVLGGTPSDVGSGPTVSDPTGVADARCLLRRYAPDFVDLPLVRSGPVPNHAGTRTVASPEELARLVASELRDRGVGARVLPPSNARVEDLAEEYATAASRLRPGHALVRAAEPSVEVPRGARGHGGRSTHLAALVAPRLPKGVVFLAAATDGVDGASGTAGALVDASVVRRIGREVFDSALARFDTGPLLIDAGTALPWSPTGHNLADLHVLARS